MKIVNIDTEDFKARALHFQELPALSMIRMLDDSLTDNQRVIALLDVIRQALLDPSKIDEFNALTMNAMQEVLNAYVSATPAEMDWNE